MPTLDYIVTPVDAAAHRFRVVLQTDVVPGDTIELALPSWIPGSYVIRDFARHMLSIAAESGGEAIYVQPIDRQRWQCTPGSDHLTVACEFYARDESVRAAFLDDTRGFFNFTSLALRPTGRENDVCRVTLDPPSGISDWQVATTLPAVDVDSRGFGGYEAESYWALIDQPVAMGNAIEYVRFQVRGVPHAFVLLGSHDADTQRLAADLAAVCEAQAAVFDELPAREYLFLAQITANGFGGLEHCESSVLQVPRAALPSRVPAANGESVRSEAYETLLGLCSHEYFHLWNVKRIRPQAVAENDLQSEAYFRDLWAYEGVTSYFDDLGLVRAGLISEQGYLDRLATLATRIDRTPGRHRQSLSQSSFDAWLKFYRPDENTPNAVISYYGKGAQFALGLDLKLRVETDGAVSLDDVMRRAWEVHGREDRPVPEHGLAAIAAEASGLDLDIFTESYLETIIDAPWADWLGYFGIDAMFAPGKDDEAALRGRFGVRTGAGAQPRVSHVFDDTPAQTAGISPQDRLVAIDGIEVGANLVGQLRRYPAGAVVAVHLFRSDELLVRHVTLGRAAAGEWKLRIDENADSAAHARRARWLKNAHSA
ncbi:protease with the C-terminal PDZ domain [Salinisphaera dokdonensis CL-ES53]|uniref:Protease with the C-terminal PDZ domain n=1 Tax=Salinisphaera dokdonensis CL-ES53 TaxID=1304272 RepID=A0ABV2AY72_9GAMM